MAASGSHTLERPAPADSAAPKGPGARVQIYAASGNAQFAEKVAQAAAREGFAIVNGDFAESGAEAVIVVWSGVSIGSAALIAAAKRPLERGALVPVSIGRVEPPEAFRSIAPVNLGGWSGESLDPRWRFVVDEIQRIARAPASAEPPPQEPAPPADAVPAQPAGAPPAASPTPAATDVEAPRPRRMRLALAGCAVLVMSGATALLSLGERGETEPSPPPALAAEAFGGLDAAVIDRAIITVEPPMIGAIRPVNESPPTLPRPAAGPRPAGPAASVAAPQAPLVEAAPEKDELAALIAEATANPVAQPADDPLDALARAERSAVRPGDLFKDCDSCPEMTAIPAGSFRMGSPDGERARRASEGPVVEVSLAKPFALARSETTVAQWNECVAAGPCAPLREATGANRPAVNVSFDDAEVFARWLSEKTGASYRLPSEAEWEYAARAGAETPFASGPSISAREASFDASIPYGGKPGVPRRAPSPVASFPANAFGLYDMAGNVWEWTADCWSPSHAGAPADGAPRAGACSQRVLKGGAWNTGGWRLRAAHRIGKPAGAREYDNGFRVARDL